MNAFQDRYIILIGGYQYEETYYLNATHGPSYGLPTRMCPQHTAAAQGLGCLPHCAADMKNTTYMDGPVKGANWSREYNNDGKCSRSLCVFFRRSSKKAAAQSSCTIRKRISLGARSPPLSTIRA